jgi:hypothetical protein
VEKRPRRNGRIRPFALDFGRVERAPPPAAFDFDVDLGVDFARVERTLLSVAFDLDLEFAGT